MKQRPGVKKKLACYSAIGKSVKKTAGRKSPHIKKIKWDGHSKRGGGSRKGVTNTSGGEKIKSNIVFIAGQGN